ncbi:MAG: hypothetical protein ACP6IS_05300 [Candidatus Asgardarchaeia archaeon]
MISSEKLDEILKTLAAVNLLVAIIATVGIYSFKYPLTVKSFTVIWFPLYVAGISLAARYRVVDMQVKANRVILEWWVALIAMLAYILLLAIFG